MNSPGRLFGGGLRFPFRGGGGGQRVLGPVVCSLALHLLLLVGARMVELPAQPAALPDEPIEISLLAGGGEAGAGDEGGEGEGLPAPAPQPPVRAIRQAPPPPAPSPAPQQTAKVLAVAPKAEQPAAEEALPVAEEELQQEEAPELVVAEQEEVSELEEAAESEGASLLDGALADASAALGAGRGRGHGLGGGGPGGGLGGGGGGSAFGTGPVDGSKAAVPPRIQEQVAPSYPRMARRRGIEGRVVLHLVVDQQGRVEKEHTKVLESLPGLDSAAVAAVNQWRFSPARDRAGTPLRSFIRLPIRFSLQ